MSEDGPGYADYGRLKRNISIIGTFILAAFVLWMIAIFFGV